MGLSLLLFFLGVYGVGCGVSQSLMSLGGAVFAVLGLIFSVRALKNKCDSFTRGQIYLGLSLVVYLVFDLILREKDARLGHTLGDLPLQWVPLFGWVFALSFGEKAFNIEKKRFAIPLFCTALALLVEVLRALMQVLHGGLAAGFFGNSIYYSYNLIAPLVFFTELGLNARADEFGFFKKRQAFVAAAIAFVGIFLSETRMSWLVAGIFVSIRFFPYWAKQFGKLRSALIALGGAAVMLLISLSQPLIRAKLERTFSAEDPSRHWRWIAWKHNFELFLQHPFFGVGPEKNGIDTAIMPTLAGHWEPGHLIFAHSIYFQAAADSGLIGLLLLMLYWFRFGRANALSRSIVAVGAFAGITENIMNNSKAFHPFLFYTLFAMLLFPRTETKL